VAGSVLFQGGVDRHTHGRLTASGRKVGSAAGLGRGMMVSNSTDLRCDGCGQAGSAEHMARRLRRLEWATRYRPVHIHTLLLSAVAPRHDAEFLYAPGDEFRGEAADLLKAVGISTRGKAPAAIHGEFQAAGFFLTHLLECPVEVETVGQRVVCEGQSGYKAPDPTALLREHLGRLPNPAFPQTEASAVGHRSPSGRRRGYCFDEFGLPNRLGPGEAISIGSVDRSSE
jgi:hypothetical protein